MSTVAVIIVSYNSGGYLQSAINHLQHQHRQPDEILIIDNASTDGSIDRLNLSELPQARLICLPENTGFAKANNIAALETQCDWLALLNPDTEARAGWLEQLLAAHLRHADASIFTTAQLDAVNSSILDGAGDAYSVVGIPWRGGFGRPASEMPEEGECFSPCGASMMIRRDLFLEVGGFDETFFCYCEDVDLGFRLRLRDERCIFVPSAVVHHHGSAITGRYSDFTIRLGTRNRLRTYLQNMPPTALALTLPGHVLATLYLYLRAIGKPYAKAMRIGLFEALGDIGGIWKRRKEIQATRTVSSWQIMQKMSWNPLQLSRRKTHVWRSRRDRPKERQRASN
ncbi:MAG: glycosyltransferase family 2 protein [Henriciella sp.]|uniref:glycosyltransferase family 2 protein n=1 Tax=Henriciella sp. TaxID=1968823 RepID=UPI003C778AE2